MYVPVEGFQEQSRSKIVDELRRSIKVDNHEVVRIGELEKNSKAIKAVGPKFDGEVFQTRRSAKGGRIEMFKR